MQLEELAQLLTGRVRRPELIRARCPTARTGRSGCDACARVCPQAAVTFGRGPLIGESCDGCGLCEAACPQEALRSDSATPPAVPGPDGVARYRCPWGEGKEASTTVRCLGTLSLSDLLEPIAGGATAVELDGSACHRCDKSQWLSSLQERAELARNLAGGSGDRLRVSRAGDLPRACVDGGGSARASSPPLSRRGFFDIFRQQVGSWTPGPSPKLAAPERAGAGASWGALPPERARLIAALSRLQPPSIPLETAAPFASLRVSGRCEGCPICSDLCPSSALRREATPCQAELWFRPGACTGCGLCASVCPMQALSVCPAASPAPALRDEVLRLAAVTLVQCASCGQPFAPGEAGGPRCPACEWRPASRVNRPEGSIQTK